MHTSNKLIEKLFNDGRTPIAFTTPQDGIAYGKEQVEKNKAKELSIEEEINRRVEAELIKRGVKDLSQSEALNFTSLTTQVYGTEGTNDDTMPQITEDSRDVSPSYDSKNQANVSQEHSAVVTDKKQGRTQKKGEKTFVQKTKSEQEKTKPNAIDMSVVHARASEMAKVSNLLDAVVSITHNSHRATEFTQGNDKLQVKFDPSTQQTFAYINDKMVGKDQAIDFLYKMNKELGLEKADQLRKVVDLAKNNPTFDKHMGQEQKNTKSQDVSGR